MPDEPVFYEEGNEPKPLSPDYRVEQKILGALRTPSVGGAPSDADLQALGDMTCTGIIVRTGAGAFTCRSLVAPAAGITIGNPDGIVGNPTFALANDLAALEALAGSGFLVRTGSETWTLRSIDAGVGIQILTGDGVSGAPVIALNINGLTEEATIAAGDFLAIYDVSASAHRKMTRANLVSGLSGSVASKSARIRKSSSQAIATSTNTELTFQAEDFDTDTIADVVGTPTRLTAKTVGKYVISASSTWLADATGNYREMFIRKNGSERLAGNIIDPTSGHNSGPFLSVSTIAHLEVNDYVEAVVQTNGSAGLVGLGSNFSMISYG